MTKRKSTDERLRSPKWKPSPVDIELMRRNFADSKTEDLATVCGVAYHQITALAAKLGLKKSAAFYAAYGNRTDGTKGTSTRFQPGLQPWNKGQKLPGYGAPHTFFAKGAMPHNHVPVGSFRVNSFGYVEIKLNDDPGPYYVRWKPVHRLVWEQAHGPIPAGHVVVFQPGQKTTDPTLVTLDKLACITQAENMRRNSVHALYPPEVAQVVQLRGVLTRMINQAKKGLTP